MVCRITLNLRTTVYGSTTFERTNNSIPLSDLRNPRSGRSDQTVDSTATKNLEVHIRKEYDRSKDRDHFVEFGSGGASGAAYHQKAGEAV
jgi:hypothetical protein